MPKRRPTSATRKPPRDARPAAPAPVFAKGGTVFVVDDDPAVRDSLELLMESVGLPTRCFGSAEDFLKAAAAPVRGCLLLDVRMPGMGGLELQETMAARGVDLPVIILTGHADVPMAVRAMRGGALDFIEKPCNEQVLLARIAQALGTQARAAREESRSKRIASRARRLSPREREVMALVVAGKSNKQMAAALGVTVKTIEVHRARVMTKMEAQTLPDLVKMSLLTGEEQA